MLLYLKDVLQGSRAHLPLSLGEVDPHEDTYGHRKGAIHEAGLDTKCEEHARSSVAIKDQLGMSTLRIRNGVTRTHQVAIPMIELVKKVTGPVLTLGG